MGFQPVLAGHISQLIRFFVFPPKKNPPVVGDTTSLIHPSSKGKSGHLGYVVSIDQPAWKSFASGKCVLNEENVIGRSSPPARPSRELPSARPRANVTKGFFILKTWLY